MRPTPRSTLAPIIVLTVLATLVLTAAPAGSVIKLQGPCELRRQDGETVRNFSRRLIRCSVERLGPVPGGTERAICIAKRESGLYPDATSEPTGEYRGLFQHDRDYWSSRFDTYTEPAWDLSKRALNGRTNAIVTIRMVADFGRWKAAGWPRRDC
jgi:hypothetical protein